MLLNRASEVVALMKVCSRRAPTGIRDRVLIALLWRTGLRISEALDLKSSDIVAAKGTVRVAAGKNGKHRLSPHSQPERSRPLRGVADYLNERGVPTAHGGAGDPRSESMDVVQYDTNIICNNNFRLARNLRK